jgi:Cys-rich repeat protein
MRNARRGIGAAGVWVTLPVWHASARLWMRLTSAAILVAATVSGCGNDPGKNADCSSFCRSFCKQLDTCQIDGSSSCQADCTAGLGSARCSDARPPDQLTCDELRGLYECASYCATLCTRGPQCGSFDSTLCVEGCAARQPIICNPASVAARTCDQLKPELREYEDIGRSSSQPGDQGSFGGSGSAFGLCRSNSDCNGQRCDLATNVCGPCKTDADCKEDFGAHMCAPDGSCMRVQCVEDADCPGQRCDTAMHKCVRCLVDADCTGQVFLHCNPAKNTCVQCTTDADCNGQSGLGTHCGLTAPADSICVECNTDADCVNPLRPHCGVGLSFCM